MTRRFASLVALAALVALSDTRASGNASVESRLVVHEWGTFTSVAGADGQAIEWRPQAGPSDLPCFVDRLAISLKGSLRGTVRMETPVLYFYAPGRLTVDVHVRFPQGLVTEWFPRALVTPRDAAVFERNARRGGSIEWRQVVVAPNGPEDFPTDAVSSHYYAARLTESAPLAVTSQHERFLFYRGVGQFAPPIAAIVVGDTSVVVRNAAADAISDAVLFDNHDGSVSVQMVHGIRGEATFDAMLPADIAPVKGAIEQMLVANGLYPAEAAAMVATWGDSWFEEGTRVFYVLPASAIDAILPLDVTPAPASTVRVFVGRMELMSAATLRTVKAALLANDRARLATYGRFIEPIAARIMKESAQEERPALERALQDTRQLWETTPACATSTTND